MTAHWTDERLDERLTALEQRLERIEALDGLDARFEGLRSQIDARFDALDIRFAGMQQQINAWARTLLIAAFTMVAALIAALVAVVAAVAY